MVTLSRGKELTKRYSVNDTPDRMARMVITNKFKSIKPTPEDNKKRDVTEVAKGLSGQLYAWGDPLYGPLLAAMILRVRT